MDESLKRVYTDTKARRRADGTVVSGAEAEKEAQAAAAERALRDARIRAGTKTETFRLAVPARSPIPPAKRKPKE